MESKIESINFIDDLDQVVQLRKKVSTGLKRISEQLAKAKVIDSLNSDMENINIAQKNLEQGVFRILVLGDMKRGKSTFVNALIGDNILPYAANPCTAILTILRYGKKQQVTVHFNNGKKPEKLELKEFKQKYTINPQEAKQLKKENKIPFAEVSYAEIQHPLPLLSKGLEIIDSPGLNDTEDRNELSLGYINNCHVVVFLMRASQPYTMAERRYLDNYIKDRGLSVFFVINGWDQIKEGILDPNDQEELQEAEEQLRQLFKTNLSKYCQINGEDVYQKRVFEVSAINALRKKIKDPSDSLEGTGFPEFLHELNIFLTRERAIAELKPAMITVRQARSNIHSAIERRLVLLGEDITEMKRRISSVEPEFKELGVIRDLFQQEIRSTRDVQSQMIADSLRSYIMGLGDTFEVDFLEYQPTLEVFDFLNKNKREAFNESLKQAFEQYTADKIGAWTQTVEKDMDSAFAKLSHSAAQYGKSYKKVMNHISYKLSGEEVKLKREATDTDEDSPNWTKWAMGLLSLSRGNIAGVAMAQVGFDWKNILLNYIAAFGVNTITGSITGIFLGPIGLALLGMGIGFFQADQARQKLVQTTKKELVKYLPQIAQEYTPHIRSGVEECFNTYEREVVEQINQDIKNRRAELDHLVEQKEQSETQLQTESQHLQTIAKDVDKQIKEIEKNFHLYTGQKIEEVVK